MNGATFLEELRSIAHLGLNYTPDPYDRERYTRLMALAAAEYAALTGLPADEVAARFRQELGYITPKVGVAAAVFNEQGQLLLVRRSDNGKWGLPAGFCEVNQTPQDNLRREVREETGLEVEIDELIDIFCVLPGEFGQPHTIYSLLFLARQTGGSLTPSHETPEIAFRDLASTTDWHFDHQRRAERAQTRWLEYSKRG